MKSSVKFINYSVGSALSLILIVLLFLGDPKELNSRVFLAAWDLGHIALFFILTLLVFNGLKFDSKKIVKPILVTGFVVLLISIPIELIQGQLLRSASVLDILRNIAGAVLALTVRHYMFHKRLLPSVLSLAFCFLLATPFLLETYDWIKSKQEFPIISDFENPKHLKRWRGNELTLIPSQFSTVLNAKFNNTEYSGLSLIKFIPDWRGYQFLNFDIVNPTQTHQELVLRIHDIHHKDFNHDYNDRFNKTLKIEPGINQYQISLEEIMKAPKARNMNLSNIERLAFFTIQLKQPIYLLFDNIHLSN